MYSNNNNAKECILRELSETLSSKENISILDFACGTCSIWKDFLKKHPTLDFNGFDFNINAINIAKKNFPDFKERILILDGQDKLPFEKKFDIITTFSSLEHVVNKKYFIKNISKLLKSGGTAYINYDCGHFKNGILENIYNYISQVLAKFNLTEKYFTKKVNLDEVISIIKNLELEILEVKFFNIQELKNLHKNLSTEADLEAWYKYELSLNRSSNKNKLQDIMLSTVIKLKRK